MKKIPKIIIIFLILLCTLIPNCFADGDYIDYENNKFYFTINNTSYNITIPSEAFNYSNMLIVYGSYSDYSKAYTFDIYCSNSEIYYNGERNICCDSSLLYYYGNHKEGIKTTTNYNSYNSSSTRFSYITYKILANCNIYDKSKEELIFQGTPLLVNPSFITLEEDLKTGNFNNIEIAPNDYAEPFYLHVAEISRPVAEDTSIIYYTNQKAFYLGADVSYYIPTGNLYSVPKSELGFAIETGKEYIFAISSNSSSLSNISEEEIFQKVEVIAEERSENAILNDKMDIQNETSKGMWDTLKDILSYINPFSENFFVYKLIEMLIEALKSLFIPQDGFLGTYFEELKNWFSDRLGFLFYPFELLIDILNQILGINFSEPVFNIPDINEPFTNTKLISATTFNFNSLLENNVLKTIHDIYLLCLDAFIVFELVNLFRRKYEEVTTK